MPIYRCSHADQRESHWPLNSPLTPTLHVVGVKTGKRLTKLAHNPCYMASVRSLIKMLIQSHVPTSRIVRRGDSEHTGTYISISSCDISLYLTATQL